MSAGSIRVVGSLLARTTYDECRQLAEIALQAPSAITAREAVHARLT
jgi:phosphoenolpyruvate-protein kinase (PTS system EI component)